MYCRQCGARIADGLKFCPQCGVEQAVKTPAAGSACVWPEWEMDERPIGRGSFGAVYRAVRHDHNVESFAAIKVITIPSDPSEVDSLRSEGMGEDATRTYLQGIVNDFVSEIQLMESFKGMQNIVSVEDYRVVEKVGEIGWDIYIRMELLTPFNSYLCDKTLSEAEVIKLGIDICTALEICAKRNVIHRDIKPENIFINDFGYFKLGDFGIARKLENMSGGLSQKGTFNYMAPEVAYGREYDARVDIYSLGIMLYRLLNGNRLPFLNTQQQILNPNERRGAAERRLRGEALPPPCGASPAMTEIILRACAYEPERRFSSASEMKQALMRVADGTYLPETEGAQTITMGMPEETVTSQLPTMPPAPPVRRDASVFCSKCGSLMTAGLRFCPRCGAMQEPASARPVQNGEKTRGRILLAGVIGSVCLLLAILVFLVCWAISNSKAEPLYYISRETYYDRSGNVDGWGESVYDEQGNIQTYTSYHEDGTVDSWTDYAYDKDGRPLADITYNSNGAVDSRLEYTYDSKGRVVVDTMYDADGKKVWEYKYVYDAQGRQTGGSYGDDGPREEYSYNESGQVESITQYDEKENLQGWSEYTYDPNGNVLTHILYDAKGNVTSREVYTYDDQNRVIKIVVYDGNGKETSSRDFQYEEQIETGLLPGDGSAAPTTSPAVLSETAAPKETSEPDSSTDAEPTVLLDPSPSALPESEPEPAPEAAQYICVEETDYDGNGERNEWVETFYDEDGKPLAKIFYCNDGSVSSWNTFSYDENGNKQTEKVFSGGRMTYCWEYTCDENGNVLTKEDYYDGVLTQRHEYTYDEDGKLLSHTNHNGNSTEQYEPMRIVYTYDANGNETGWKCYWLESGDLESESETVYDERGIPVTSEGSAYEPDGSLWMWWTSVYDSHGNEIEYIEKEVYGDGEISTYRYECTYNEDGNRLIRKSYESDGQGQWWYDYSYDAAGNETRCERYDAAGALLSWTQYEYMTLDEWNCTDHRFELPELSQPEEPEAETPPEEPDESMEAAETQTESVDEDSYKEYLHAWLNSEYEINDAMTEEIKAEIEMSIDAGAYGEFPGEMLFNGMLISGSAMTYEEFAASGGEY